MEKSQVIIVDESDEVIGYKDRDSVISKDIYRVAALWVENSEGKVLLVQRAFSKKNDPGRWGPAVSGTLEKGETYDSNIIKEAEEEIGLKNCEFQKGEKIRVTGKHNYFVQWYFVSLDKEAADFKINKEGAEGIEWFSREDLEKMIEENSEKLVTGIKRIPKL